MRRVTIQGMDRSPVAFPTGPPEWRKLASYGAVYWHCFFCDASSMTRAGAWEHLKKEHDVEPPKADGQ